MGRGRPARLAIVIGLSPGVKQNPPPARPRELPGCVRPRRQKFRIVGERAHLRGSLALAGAGRLIELAAAALVLGLQAIDPPLEGLTVATPDRFHARTIRSSPRFSGGVVAAGGRLRLSFGR